MKRENHLFIAAPSMKLILKENAWDGLFFWIPFWGALNRPECPEKDLDVKGNRPILDVVQIIADTLLQRGVATESVDLCPAGESAFDPVPV